MLPQHFHEDSAVNVDRPGRTSRTATYALWLAVVATGIMAFGGLVKVVGLWAASDIVPRTGDNLVFSLVWVLAYGTLAIGLILKSRVCAAALACLALASLVCNIVDVSFGLHTTIHIALVAMYGLAFWATVELCPARRRADHCGVPAAPPDTPSTE
jgi:hypothetical protein